MQIVGLEPEEQDGMGPPELLEDAMRRPRSRPGRPTSAGAWVDLWLAQPTRRTLVPTVCAVVVATLVGAGLVDHGQPISGAGRPAQVTQARANGEITIATDRGVELVDPVTGTRQVLSGVPWSTGKSAYEALSWSPDGRRLGYVEDATSAVHPMEGGAEISVGASLDPDINRFQWSADATTYVQWGADVVARLKADDGFQEVTSASWSSDGRRVAFIGRLQGRLGLYVAEADLSGLHPVDLAVNDADFGPVKVAWSPDGRWLAYLQISMPKGLGSLRETLMAVRPDGSDTRQLADAGIAMQTGAPAVAPNLAWSPDSTMVAVIANYAGVRDRWGIYVVTLDGTVHPVLVGPITSAALAWRPTT